jgi:hypothetical protein
MKKLVCAIAIASALVVGCDKDKGGAGGAASASGSPSGGASVAAATPTKLTQKDLDDAYKAKNIMDPFDKQLAAVEAKIGKAQKVDGDTYYWWGWDAASKTCYQLDMNKTKGNSLGGTSDDKCGTKK